MSEIATEKRCLAGLVKGRVQGVFFRAETQAMARQLEVCGWVRNTVEGDVEVLLQGNAEALAKMQDWLLIGPPRARVDAVQLGDCISNAEVFTSFVIRN